MSSFFFHEAYFKNPSSVFGGHYYFSPIHEQWARWLVDRHAPKNVIDVCCGYGHYLKAFDQLGVNTFGVDVSAHAIEQARAITKATLFQRDLERGPIPIETRSMDVALLVNSLEYFKNERRLLSEIHRVLRPGGVLFFSDVNGGWLSRFLNRNIQARIPCWKVRAPRQVHEALKDTRFTILSSQPNGGPIDSLHDRHIPRFVLPLRRSLERLMEPGYFITLEAMAI
jgi:SAM-dependent methyltransferase